ncbi:TRADD-N-associated membrane domain-containing protein [Nocardia sp. NPDC003345]
MTDPTSAILFLVAPAGTLIGILVTAFFASRRFNVGADEIVLSARAEREDLIRQGATSAAETAIVSNTALFNQYHSRSLLQAQISFFFSLGAASVGFVIIVIALWTVGRGGFDQAGVAGVQLSAALIIEIVAALFFRLSNQSRALLISFFDKLRKDRQFEEALTMARQLPPESSVRDRLHVAVALHLIDAPEEVLAAILNGSEPALQNQAGNLSVSHIADMAESSK